MREEHFDYIPVSAGMVSPFQNVPGSWLSTIRWPAIAQSMPPVSLMRRSRYQPFTDMTIVSVVSSPTGSGGHCSERRVERRQVVGTDRSGLAMVEYISLWECWLEKADIPCTVYWANTDRPEDFGLVGNWRNV